LHERQETVVADLRAKLKQLRVDGAARDRQLELAHRTIERLSVGKNNLEAGKAANKAYIRQLETRVAGMRGVGELHTMCESLKGELLAQQRRVQEAEEKAAIAKEESQQYQQEVQLLQRGVQLAAEQLARSSGGTSISATMLMAVAKGQEEAITLSQQLAESQEQIHQMSEALSAARSHLQTQHEVSDMEILQNACTEHHSYVDFLFLSVAHTFNSPMYDLCWAGSPAVGAMGVGANPESQRS